MGILQDSELKRLGSGLISPYREEYVQPASIDLHLGGSLFVSAQIINKGLIRPEVDSSEFFKPINMESEGHYVMRPDEFLVGATHEAVTVPANMVARFEGKSSLGRLGLMTHVTAGFIDPGFKGNITVEIKNLTEHYWTLIPGMKIGQICFETLEGLAEKPYGSGGLGSHYQGDYGPSLSRIHQNFKLHPHFERNEQDVEE